MNEQNCGSCMFSTGSSYQNTYCHRYAPRQQPEEGRAMFPLMGIYDWCGDYVGRDGRILRPRAEP